MTVVQLRSIDGSVLGDAQILEVAGYRVFLTELTKDRMYMVGLRADGSEVGRTSVKDFDEKVTLNLGDDDSASESGSKVGTPVDSEGTPIPDPAQPSPTTAAGGD